MTALALLPSSLHAIETAKQETAHVSRVIEVHKLETPEDEATAGALLRELARLEGDLDKARKLEKAPFLASGRAVDALFSPALNEIARVSDMLRARVQEAITNRERARIPALREAALAAQSGDGEGANRAMLAIPVDVSTPGISERWTYEPISVRLKEVPETYLALDMARVKAYIRECVARDVVPSIPGIEFQKKAEISVRKA